MLAGGWSEGRSISCAISWWPALEATFTDGHCLWSKPSWYDTETRPYGLHDCGISSASKVETLILIWVTVTHTLWHCHMKELNLEWISSVVAEFLCGQDSKGLYHAHGHAHSAPMSKCLWRCTSTAQDSSNKLNLKWISPGVTELWHLQSLGWTNWRTDEQMDERMNEWTNGQRAFHSPPHFLWKGWGTKNFCSQWLQHKMTISLAASSLTSYHHLVEST